MNPKNASLYGTKQELSSFDQLLDYTSTEFLKNAKIHESAWSLD